MSDRSGVTIAPRQTTDASLEWPGEIDEGCISVGGLAVEMGWHIGPGPLKERSPCFGPVIALTRDRVGFTAEEFAGRVGVSVAKLAEIEGDAITPPLETIRRIAEALDGDFILLKCLAGLATEEDLRQQEEAASRREPAAALVAATDRG